MVGADAPTVHNGHRSHTKAMSLMIILYRPLPLGGSLAR
jgi:hypothetical protein